MLSQSHNNETLQIPDLSIPHYRLRFPLKDYVEKTKSGGSSVTLPLIVQGKDVAKTRK